MIRFVIFKDSRGEYRWHLKAKNNEVIAVSEGYTTKQNAIYSINLVKRVASIANVFEQR